LYQFLTRIVLTGSRTIFFFATDMLIFCPITVVVGLAIRDKAFAAVNLMSAQAVFEVGNWGPVQRVDSGVILALSGLTGALQYRIQHWWAVK
jgi:hypothetical protein